MYHHAGFCRRRRSSSTSSTASTVSWTSNHHHHDQQQHRHHHHHDVVVDNVRAACSGSQISAASSSSPPPSPLSSSCNVRTCEGMTADETRELWKCMLALQQRYGCYNSRRIDLAANAGDDEGVNLMPNPFIIDTLNNSVIDLPSEGWEMLDRCLRGHDEACASASSPSAACQKSSNKPNKCEGRLVVACARQ
ncbi:hypothetical protein JDV02_002448 [Purpureocillium takamizusanense]|uniref:Uncharacterized protein n=1 Tax=Purpureocillium takamizusanense TaxID=2060973 RepID=A0A9Q8QBU0_9HYPO|nr:uncharacterized protein JDV02_002448 [Purpureocillium takamizusanense]UNI15967.1 hypothetical protein JDV02_002448 [Purpureocillium takamizusanense]